MSYIDDDYLEKLIDNYIHYVKENIEYMKKQESLRNGNSNSCTGYNADNFNTIVSDSKNNSKNKTMCGMQILPGKRRKR